MSAGLKGRREARVLVVDDEPQMVKIVEGVLRILGVGSISTAIDGQEALKLVKSSTDKPFDLVVCDWQMPSRGRAGGKITRSIFASVSRLYLPGYL